MMASWRGAAAHRAGASPCSSAIRFIQLLTRALDR
jgi:hypothetical protein